MAAPTSTSTRVSKLLILAISIFVVIFILVLLISHTVKQVYSHREFFNESELTFGSLNCSNIIELDEQTVGMCLWSEGVYTRICMRNLILPNCIILADHELNTVCKHLPAYFIQGRGLLDN